MRKALTKWILLPLALVLCLSCALSEPAVGAWQAAAWEAQALPEGAQAAFDKATEAADSAHYTPVALLSTQLVAGMNYCILCQVTPVDADAALTWALVYIYADLQGNAQIRNVYELYIERHAEPAASSGEGMTV